MMQQGNMDTAYWDLEYALLFGIPNNKIELIDGRSRCAFPFMSREEAEFHFSRWLQTLTHWKGDASDVQRQGTNWKATVAGISIELFPRPIEIRIPIAWEAFDRIYETFWGPELWPGEGPSWHGGFLAMLDHQDVQMNLWSLFASLCARHGGKHGGRIEVALSDTSVVAPDQYYYGPNHKNCTFAGGYFRGVPELIAEVLSPASHAVDRGPRQELYRRAGLKHLWLVDPAHETVEVLVLKGEAFEKLHTYGPGETFESELFPGGIIQVEALFKTQSKKWDRSRTEVSPEPIPEWLLAPELKLGLEYFFLLGHPERRWEIWGNRAPSVLAFGSTLEAKTRLTYFLEEACRWESAAKVTPALVAPDVEQAEVGRFRLTRCGRHVHLDVAVDARKFRELLTVWSRNDCWDWGEDDA